MQFQSQEPQNSVNGHSNGRLQFEVIDGFICAIKISIQGPKDPLGLEV
jgi:hypothetical protein